MNNNYTTFINVSLSLPSLSHTPEHVSGAERWEFPLPAHVGVRSPAPPAQSRTRSLRSIPLPAHLQFHPAPEKIAPRSLKFKITLHA